MTISRQPMPLAEAVTAVRESVAYGRRDDVAQVWLTGPGAYDGLDRVCAGDLRVRDGQLLKTLFLNEDATCFADVLVGCDDDDFFVVAEGPSPADLMDYLKQYLAAVPGVGIEDRSGDAGLVTLDGPFAWELLGRALGQEAIGLPHLTFFHVDGVVCYRAGTTGEYGYGVLGDRRVLDGLYRRVAAEGEAFDAVEAGLDAYDQCALENGFFCIRREGRLGLTPLELQLQWRVSYAKEYVGAEALRQRRRVGALGRVTWLLSLEALAMNDALSLGEVPVGRVVNKGWSVALDEWVGLGLIECRYAHPGLDLSLVGSTGTVSRARTVSAPVINNHSLFVSPQLHSYSRRDEQAFPSLRRR